MKRRVFDNFLLLAALIVFIYIGVRSNNPSNIVGDNLVSLSVLPSMLVSWFVCSKAFYCYETGSWSIPLGFLKIVIIFVMSFFYLIMNSLLKSASA